MKVQKKLDWRNLSEHFAVLVLAALVFSGAAFGAQGGGALPWEAPLTKLQQSLSGPVAGAIAVIALVAIGVVLVFGGEWNEFARRSVYAVCAIAFDLRVYRESSENNRTCLTADWCADRTYSSRAS